MSLFTLFYCVFISPAIKTDATIKSYIKYIYFHHYGISLLCYQAHGCNNLTSSQYIMTD